MQATRQTAGSSCRRRARAPARAISFRIDGEIDVPDPASHFQPEDVTGRAKSSTTATRGDAPDWNGGRGTKPYSSKLHVGTFTPAGTFRGAIDKLDHIVATGITAIELMPLADFAGRWNWGYDGVLLYRAGQRLRPAGRPEGA